MVLVTGASGLLGSHVLLALLKKGYAVRALATAKSSVAKAEKTFTAYSQNDAVLFSNIEWVL